MKDGLLTNQDEMNLRLAAVDVASRIEGSKTSGDTLLANANKVFTFLRGDTQTTGEALPVAPKEDSTEAPADDQ